MKKVKDYLNNFFKKLYNRFFRKKGLCGFNDLVFNPHRGFSGGAIQAKLTFGWRNKYNFDQFTISVIQNVGGGTGLYGHEKDGNYEVAMWFQDRDKMLPLSVGDDVLGWQTPTDITRLMHQAQLNDFAWVTLLHNLRDDFNKELGI